MSLWLLLCPAVQQRIFKDFVFGLTQASLLPFSLPPILWLPSWSQASCSRSQGMGMGWPLVVCVCVCGGVILRVAGNREEPLTTLSRTEAVWAALGFPETLHVSEEVGVWPLNPD